MREEISTHEEEKRYWPAAGESMTRGFEQGKRDSKRSYGPGRVDQEVGATAV